MKGIFEGEYIGEGELLELVFKRDGYFLRGEFIREGSKKDRKRWRGRVMIYLLRIIV